MVKVHLPQNKTVFGLGVYILAVSVFGLIAPYIWKTALFFAPTPILGVIAIVASIIMIRYSMDITRVKHVYALFFLSALAVILGISGIISSTYFGFLISSLPVVDLLIYAELGVAGMLLLLEPKPAVQTKKFDATVAPKKEEFTVNQRFTLNRALLLPYMTPNKRNKIL